MKHTAKLIISLWLMALCSSCSPSERCDNAIDDDGDGLIDCYDPDCAAAAICQEACDNNKDDDLDGAADCTDDDCYAHPRCVAARCGNGMVEPQFEECDKALPVELTCADRGFHSGTVVCTDTCTLDISDCTERCGDGTVNGDEECDEGAANADTPNATCRTNCLLRACGDGILDTMHGEQCDLGDQNSDEPDQECRTDCTLPRCGDGVRDHYAGERCDDGSANSNTTPDACREDCTAPACGDGVIDSDEECEGSDLDGKSCLSLHFYGGTLSCSNCLFSLSDCQSYGWCGNGLIEPTDEFCDKAAPVTSTCAAEGYWYGSLGCALNCQGYRYLGCLSVDDVGAGGDHSCALNSDGEAYCVGSDYVGQLGTTASQWSSALIPVDTPLRFASLATGEDHSCAITAGGDLYCWGDGNSHQLGDGSWVNRETPVKVYGYNTYSMVTAGWDHTCAIRISGQTQCWGDNGYGQSGDTSVDSFPITIPTTVPGNHFFSTVSAGKDHTCAVDTASKGWCWGFGNYGQLGYGYFSPYSGSRDEPTAVAGDHDFVSICAGGLHSCGVDTAGQAWCWGDGTFGQLGYGGNSQHNTPVAVSGSLLFSEVGCGEYFTCGLTQDSKVYCWGYNYNSQLGYGTSSSTTPQATITSYEITRLSVGVDHSCARTSDNRIYCWGRNNYRQCGTATSSTQTSPAIMVPPY